MLWRMFCGDDATTPPEPRDTLAAALWCDLASSVDGLGAEKMEELEELCCSGRVAAADAGQKNPGTGFCAALLKLACGDTEWRPLYYAACKIYALATQRQGGRESDRSPTPGTESSTAARIDPRKPRAGQPAKYERLEDVLELAG